MANFDYLNYQTRMANGCVDNRSSSSNDGSRFERVSQSEINRHNVGVYGSNNGSYADRHKNGQY